ncbi:MAG TPA: S53 family peptidase [Acidimicrobiales bacterium]|nr:S53 family peptidase [Acidimicrobiales bacterium]
MRAVLSTGDGHKRGQPGREWPAHWRTTMVLFRRGTIAAGLLPATLAVTAAVAFLLAPVAPAGATPGQQLVALTGGAPPSPSSYGARALGPAPGSAFLSLQVYFQPDHAGQLAALATAVSTPGNASYHHFLSVPQFASRFGPAGQVVSAVDRYLTSNGLSVGRLSANGLAQDVTGTTRQFDRAFGAELVKVRTAGGSKVIGSFSVPKLPADLAGSVALVDGLDPWVVPTDNLVRLPPRQVTEGPLRAQDLAPGSAPSVGQATPPAALDCGAMAGEGLTPAELNRIYGLSGFDQRGDQGQGETIGLIEYGLPDMKAIASYEACTGASLSIHYVPTSSAPTQVDTEVAADLEVIAALAPKANVVVYEASLQGTGLAPWDLAVSGTSAGGLPDVISDSWGSCEPDTGMAGAYYQAEEVLYEEAAAQGQTVLVASGDDGSEGCLGQTQSKQFAVYDPASAPFVTAVGGTASDTATSPQYIWNSHNALERQCLSTGCSLYGASGGGASTIWPRPGYQPASLPASPACTLGAQGCREIPDVSALAGDPYGQYCTPSFCGGGGPWVGFGGTSLAAPSWGAAVLLSDQMCSIRTGFLNPLLYSEPGKLVGSITSGNNDLSGSHDGMYQAVVSGGYSMAGGLGYLGGANLSSGALCGPNGVGAGTGSSGTGGSGSTVPTTTTTTPTTATTPTTPTTRPPTSGAGATGTATGPALECVKPVNQPVRGKPDALAATEDSNNCAGYLVVTTSGAVSGFGAAITYGSLQDRHLKAPVVAIAVTPSSEGYWLLTSDGEVFAFGDARFLGQPAGLHPSPSAVGITATPDGMGYWVAARNGAVYAFGDARSYGSLVGHSLNEPVVGIAATPDGDGYWLAAADGGVFGFGDAAFHGSMGSGRSHSQVVGITADPDGDGYFLATARGSIFSFGASFYGSRGADPPPAPVVAVAPSIDRKGYYLIDSDGQVYAYGDAIYGGNATSPRKGRTK